MAGRQETCFLEGEGNQWFKRNGEPPKNYADPVLIRIQEAGIDPDFAIEVGCGTGWRVNRLKQIYHDCMCCGTDPSIEAIEHGRRKYPDITLNYGTAQELPTPAFFDLIIFGFCLYLCDRSDLFDIVSRADRALVDGGHIVIHDFLPDYPQKRKYKHLEGVWSYKMNYSDLWLGHPAYHLISQHPTREGEGVVIIQKQEAHAWPEVS